MAMTNPQEFREELTITRTFNAPRELMWKAWTDPESVKKWWGPKDYTSPICEIDLREGGKSFFSMRSPEGQDFYSTGTYLEIVPPERLVTTDSFADEQGNVVPASHYGMDSDFPLELQVTVTFDEVDGKTRMTLVHTGFPPGEMLELTQVGWNESFDKLAESLRKNHRMNAAQINEYGGTEVVKISEAAPAPAVTAGHVLVEVRAAGVNVMDWKVREGYMRQMAPLQFPATLGIDFSGVVSQVGEGVADFQEGDEIYGQAGLLTGGSGAFAEKALADAGRISPKPKGLSHIEAAALPLVGVSAYQALVEHIGLKPGQKILIHGGAGGIGTHAIQLAKHLGAYVVTTAAADQAEYVQGLGADEVIDYKARRFEDNLRDCDAVLDTVGGETYERSFKVLKRGGVLVSMLEPPNEELMAEYGVTAVAQLTQVTSERLAKLTDLVEQGIIKTHVDKAFPLAQAAEALAYLQSGQQKGKVALDIQ